jgi:hypothetical protein
MARMTWALVAGVLLATLAGVRAADESPAGNWKVILLQASERPLWLINLTAKDGKWTGKVVGTAEQVPESTLEGLRAEGDRIRFDIKVGPTTFGFDCKLPKPGAATVFGSLTQGDNLAPVRLEATTLQSLDKFEVNREIASRDPPDFQIFRAVVELLAQAGPKKAKPEEVNTWAAKAFKAAEPYGKRWQREVALRNTELLLDQGAYAPIALEFARRAEGMLEPGDAPTAQSRVLEVLVRALRKADQAKEAEQVQARADKLETKLDEEYLKKTATIKIEPYKGRKAKSEHTVLVELFTGAECPPCVAADLGFDALAQAYKPAEVVLLEYHLHVPRPDALNNPSAQARQVFYDKEIEGTPTILFDGKAGAPGGGTAARAQMKYEEYRAVIDPLLELPARAKLKATATRKGDQIQISAQASEVDKPGENLRLRLVLVEEQVRYTGGNAIRLHHQVVRDFPGGADGLALTGKTGKQTATVNVAELRQTLEKHLDRFAATEGPFPTTQRPLDLRKLRVVAFIQDDKSKEVLQAAQVDVAGE